MRRDAGNVLRLVTVAVAALAVGWFGPRPPLPHAIANAVQPALPGPGDGATAAIAARDREIADLRAQLTLSTHSAADGGAGGTAGMQGEPNCAPPPSTTGLLVTGFQPLDASVLATTGLSEAERREVQAIADAAHDAYARTLDAIEESARQSALDLRQEITTRVGEHAYDAYLWASEQRNRLQVLRVVPNSAAARAGLQPGDEIVSYDGRRVFDYADLRADENTSPADRMDLRWRHRGEARAATVPAADLGFVAVAERVRPRAD